MLLSYNELVELVETGVIDAPMENINAASIDITLDDYIMLEAKYLDESLGNRCVDLSAKQSIITAPLNITSEGYESLDGYKLTPGEFILASSREIFNLPNDICCEYKLKSTLARNGLQHLLAGWCDAGWHGSKLTLELKNVTKYHDLLLKPGMKIGQMVFFRCAPVPDHASYAAKGQYNGQQQVTASKGLA